MTRTLVTLLAGTLLAQQAMAAGTSMIPPTDEDLRAIPRIAGERRAPFEAAPQPPRPAAARDRGGLLFVSRGMPRAELVAAIAAARADPTLTLVVRGVLPGETLADAMAAWTALLGRTATPPALLIDPRLFRRYAVAAVPTLVDTGSGAQLRGTVSPSRLAQERQQQAGRDLGRIGPTWPIAEPDLAAVLRKAAERLDLPGRAAAALTRFWRQVPAIALPPATTSSVRRIRPMARTSTALLDHTGRPAAARPQRAQPARAAAADRKDPGDRRAGPARACLGQDPAGSKPSHHPPGRQPRSRRRLARLADAAERVAKPRLSCSIATWPSGCGSGPPRA